MKQQILTGIVIDESIELSTRELCRACASSEEWVVQLVDEGVLDARGPDTASWRFSGDHLARAIRARRLEHELELNLQGVALVLDMLDEIQQLRQQLQRREP